MRGLVAVGSAHLSGSTSTSYRKGLAVSSAAFALALLGLALLAGSGIQEVELTQGKEDLSIFADSSASFYLPGDTAADSDILPRSVLADDGSSTDRAESKRKTRTPNYASSHWYKQGQTSDVHGDLQDENRQREHEEMQQYARERRHEKEQEHAMARERQERREKAVLIDRRQKLAQRRREEEYRQGDAEPQSVKGFKDSYAYRHPFANDKKGMRHLVMAEFQQDEQKMERTTDAIFGQSKKQHRWRHGGLLLHDDSHPGTLHQAMQKQRAQRIMKKKLEAKARAEHRMQTRSRGKLQEKVARPAKIQLSCSIEMLENGGCSQGNRAVQNAAPPKFNERGSYKQKIQKRVNSAKRGRQAPRGVDPNQAPTAGTVISGWAKDLGSMF